MFVILTFLFYKCSFRILIALLFTSIYDFWLSLPSYFMTIKCFKSFSHSYFMIAWCFKSFLLSCFATIYCFQSLYMDQSKVEGSYGNDIHAIRSNHLVVNKLEGLIMSKEVCMKLRLYLMKSDKLKKKCFGGSDQHNSPPM